MKPILFFMEKIPEKNPSFPRKVTKAVRR